MSADHPSAEVSGTFRRPFTEQVAFFRRKLGNLVPTKAWDDMLGAEHDDAFMVAGATKADLLADLAAAVDKAISEGRGIEEFRRDFKAIVARHGWTGWTGEGTVKGEAWRVKTILRTNSYTSYAAGRRAQLEAANFPFWVYRHGGSLEPRPEHLSWDGIALAPSHAFWIKHYPPSDWGCSCYVVGARSAAGIRRLGGDPDKKLPAGWNRIDPATGAPAGIGRGWDYAPGASVSKLVNAMAAKVRNWDYRIGKAFMDEMPADRQDQLAQAYRSLPSTADDARRFAQRIWADTPTPAGNHTFGMLRQDQVAAVARNHGGSAGGFDFSLSPDEARHVRDAHGDGGTELARGQRAIAPADFALLPRLLDRGEPRYVGLSKRHNQPVYEVAVEIGGEMFVTRWEMWRRRKTFTLLSFFVRTGERT